MHTAHHLRIHLASSSDWLQCEALCFCVLFCFEKKPINGFALNPFIVFNQRTANTIISFSVPANYLLYIYSIFIDDAYLSSKIHRTSL